MNIKKNNIKITKLYLFYLIFFPPSINAGNITFDRWIKTSSYYEDNVRFSIIDKESVSSIKASTYGALSFNSISSILDINIEAENSIYDNSAYDISTNSAGLNYQNIFEHSRFYISANSSNKSDRDVVISIIGSGDIDGKDYRVMTRDLSATYIYNYSERIQFSLSSFLQKTDFDYELRNDYEYSQSSLSYYYTVNERFKIQAKGSLSIFSPSANSFAQQQCGITTFDDMGLIVPVDIYCNQNQKFEQTDEGIQLGFNYFVSENINIDLLMGESRVENEGIFETEYSWDPEFQNSELFISVGNPSPPTSTRSLQVSKSSSDIYELSINYDATEFWASSFSASSSNKVNASGVLYQTLYYSFGNLWRLDEHQELSADLNAYEQESFILGSESQTKRESVIASLVYRFRFSEDWSLRARYSHHKMTYGITDKLSAFRNSFSLSINWMPKKYNL